MLHEPGRLHRSAHKWTFDEAYTATAIEGLDKNKDGIYDRKELAELAKVNIDGLKEFAFFTHAFLGGRKLATGEASDYWLEHKRGLLSLHFTLPFATPVPSEAKGFAFTIRDPEFFIAFELAETNPSSWLRGRRKGAGSRWASPSRSAATAPRWESCWSRWAPSARASRWSR